MRKKFTLLFLLIFTVFLFTYSFSAISSYADGRAECVMELYTDRILHKKNAYTRMPMASTTKIMTALIILEDCDLDEIITVPDKAVGAEGSSIYLKYGEKISVKDLIYGLMLRSGNDSAAALAIHHSGTIQDFAKAMNKRAKEIGATDTNFTNPSGLPDENHYTTANDLCKIACTAMKNNTFKEIVSTKNYNGQFRSYLNKNKILNTLDGANGVKTGYTLKAGRCLVSSAQRGGMNVICVVLNCPDMYERSAELINDAFDKFEVKEITQDMVFMCGIVPCKLQNTSIILVSKNSEIEYVVSKIENKKSIKKGDLLGELKIYSKNNLIFSQNLYSIIDIK